MQNNRLKTIEYTEDGSPTMKFGAESNSEKMHHSAGAATETIYIYGDAVSEAQKIMPFEETKYLVVGLGLGYIEILIGLMTNFKFKKILSFEKETSLIADFKKWTKIQDQVFLSLNEKIKRDIRLENFKEALFKSNIEFQNELGVNSISLEKYNVICYDAFSSQTDGHLWTEDFLIKFIDTFCEDNCVFSTYAKTGILNRVLKKSGFKIKNKKGFSGKREATLAVRMN